MAEAIFNKLSGKHSASSAGLNPSPKWLGQKLSTTKYVSPSMKEIGYDVNKKISKKITEKMVKDADKIVVIGEKNNWPNYLKSSKKIIFWDVEDPVHGNMNDHRNTRDKIKDLIVSLLNKIE